jgi:hypothetical protein
MNWNDKTFVMYEVREWGWALQYASKGLRDDPEVVLSAVRQDGDALRYASDRLRDDPQVILTAVEQNEDALRYASNRIQMAFAGMSVYEIRDNLKSFVATGNPIDLLKI